MSHYLICPKCLDRLGLDKEKFVDRYVVSSCDRCGMHLYPGADQCVSTDAPAHFLSSRPRGPYWVRMRQDTGRESYVIGLAYYSGNDHWYFFGSEDYYLETGFMRDYVVLGPATPPAEFSS